MKRNLISRLNQESDALEGVELPELDTVVAESTEAMGDVVEAEQAIEETSGELVQLESALIHICNLEDAAEGLVEAGVDEKVVAEQLAPVAIDAIANLDEDLGEEVQEEATLALENDDPKEASKGVWDKIREKAKQIWEAVKTAVKRFWGWLKQLFDRKAAAAKKVKASAQAILGAIDTHDSASWKTVEVALKDSWVVGGKASSAEDIKSAADALLVGADRVSKPYRTNVSQLGELTAAISSQGDREAIVKKAEEFLAAMQSKDGEAAKAQEAVVSKAGIGLAFAEGKVVAAKAPADSKITTANQATAKAIATTVVKIANTLAQFSAVEEKIVKGLDAAYADFDKAAAAVKDDAELGKFSERVKVFRDVVSASVKAAKEDFNPVLLKSANNALGFAKASLDAA